MTALDLTAGPPPEGTSWSVMGTIARPITHKDVQPQRDVAGQPRTWRDGSIKWFMRVPLTGTRQVRGPAPDMETEWRRYNAWYEWLAGYAPADGDLDWYVYEVALHELQRAMTEAGVPPDEEGNLVPEAGARITITWTGSIKIQYARPDQAWLIRQAMSPIEQKFWDAHHKRGHEALNGLVPQHPVLNYRLDFALPEHKIGIELDGFATHSSTADIAKDRQRQRLLEAEGWYLIRFGGAEVHHDAEGCVEQAACLIARRRPDAE